MTPARSVPSRGDAVWVDFSPQAGREQADRRPAVVLSPAAYNEKVGLAVLCPVTNQIKGYPFEVPLPAGLPVSGVILSDQLKSVDWRRRNASLVARLPNDTVDAVLRKVGVLLALGGDE